MTEFLKSWKFMAIIFAVLAVCAAAGVVYGVTTHTEPGFDPAMTLLVDGVARRHARVPINTCVSTYTSEHEPGYNRPSLADLNAVRQAGAMINSRVGFTLLNIGPISQVGDIRPVPCVILVNVGVPQDVDRDEGGGWAYRCADSCCIDISNTATAELTTLVIQHEFGHCLGLAHDDYEQSIMYPTRRPTPTGQLPPRLSDSDSELLRDAFGEYM